MDDTELIAELTLKVKEAEELLRRRKEALAALRGKTGAAKGGKRQRGLRADSIPALAQWAIRAAKQPLSLEDLLSQLRRSHPSLELDGRKLSLALSRYVRTGKYFTLIDGKYGVK